MKKQQKIRGSKSHTIKGAQYQKDAMNQSSTINILKSTSKHKPNEIEVKVENIYADDSPKQVRMMDPLN